MKVQILTAEYALDIAAMLREYLNHLDDQITRWEGENDVDGPRDPTDHPHYETCLAIQRMIEEMIGWPHELPDELVEKWKQAWRKSIAEIAETEPHRLRPHERPGGRAESWRRRGLRIVQ